MKKFNVTGVCIPEKHYMVNVQGKLDQIIELIEDDQYFTINRARQYGKTTTFSLLDRQLSDRYYVIRMSFEGISDESFADNTSFVRMFLLQFQEEMLFQQVPEELINNWKKWESVQDKNFGDPFYFLSRRISELCRNSDREVILMVDEVDKSSANQVFLNFLGMLREKYLRSREGRDFTFKSVILAGVYDIKNMKLKLRPDEKNKYNSPWNIAEEFNVDMSFSSEEIATMLSAYEADHHTGMDICSISEALFSSQVVIPTLSPACVNG